MIETPRLMLRNWRESDRGLLRQMNSDARVMRYFPKLMTPEESDAGMSRLQDHAQRHGFTFWAVDLRETSEFIGFIGLVHTPFETHFTPCVEIGWRLRPEFWNLGLATEGAQACVHFGFHDLALQEIVAFTAVQNRPSRRVMEKLGMTHDPADNFDHPRCPEGHPLRRHVLYRLKPS